MQLANSTIVRNAEKGHKGKSFIQFSFSFLLSRSPQLAVTIDPNKMPKLSIHDENDQFYPEETRELAHLVLSLGPGRFTITVPYPRENWWYALAWKPVRKGVTAALGKAA